MNKTNFLSVLSLLLLSSPLLSSERENRVRGTFYLDHNWLDKIVNMTPARRGGCPRLDVDRYGSGFTVARAKNFYGAIGAAASRWYGGSDNWIGVGLAPTKEAYSIVTSKVDSRREISRTKRKKLPYRASEIEKWAVEDSAYWESAGGIAFFLGTGHTPYYAGTMATAKGGWSHYVKKQGPTTVYVETAKRKIRTAGVTAGAGYGLVSISKDKIKELADGFSYQIDLDIPAAAEAYEHLMAGDYTVAQTLAEQESSGVMKVADTEQYLRGTSTNWGFGIPFIPIISYRKYRERYYDHNEEHSAWGESKINDFGIYIKKKAIRFFGHQRNEIQSFHGGKELLITNAGNETKEPIAQEQVSEEIVRDEVIQKDGGDFSQPIDSDQEVAVQEQERAEISEQGQTGQDMADQSQNQEKPEAPEQGQIGQETAGQDQDKPEGAEQTQFRQEKLFGKFVYHYESDIGQERRLRKQIRKLQRSTALVDETCVRVPQIKNSLHYNQVRMEVSYSDEYVQGLIGQGKSSRRNLINSIENDAHRIRSRFYANKSSISELCQADTEEEKAVIAKDPMCSVNKRASISESFNRIRRYTRKMQENYNKNNKMFARYVSKFGREVWSNPFVFKAFYERGKLCGQTLSYEVSGQRLSRHYINKKWNYSDNCLY